MTGRRFRLDRLEAGAAAPDGSAVSFRVVGAGGERVTLECGHGDLGPLIAFAAGLGREAAQARAEVTPATFGDSDKVSVEPIETSDVGLMRDLETGEVVLVARMSGFDLGFTVTAPQLAALRREIERALPRSALAPADDHHHHHHHHHHHDRGRDGGAESGGKA